eukprot:GHRR01017874.1.p1 GENE.GHRR01017874.1~~GHRR01017874.1.p1  ORF type:complete len:155 (+),score=39.78 GHRR01017874.1:1386-1850(+)
MPGTHITSCSSLQQLGLLQSHKACQPAYSALWMHVFLYILCNPALAIWGLLGVSCMSEVPGLVKQTLHVVSCRVPDELRKHYLSDGEGGQYSTNLDRNRYGNDDQYLFTGKYGSSTADLGSSKQQVKCCQCGCSVLWQLIARACGSHSNGLLDV